MMEEQMTDMQLDTVLKMVLQIVKDSDSKEEAIRKIEACLGKEQ